MVLDIAEEAPTTSSLLAVRPLERHELSDESWLISGVSELAALAMQVTQPEVISAIHSAVAEDAAHLSFSGGDLQKADYIDVASWAATRDSGDLRAAAVRATDFIQGSVDGYSKQGVQDLIGFFIDYYEAEVSRVPAQEKARPDEVLQYLRELRETFNKLYGEVRQFKPVSSRDAVNKLIAKMEKPE